MERITELVGVYHASGTLWGELSYWVGARLGRAHCALCDITHGTFRRKSAWVSCADTLPVPFTTYHLDDRPPDVVAASEGSTPCVLARTVTDADSGPGVLRMLVDPTELEGCAGEPAALADAVVRNAAALGLDLGGSVDRAGGA